MGWPRHVKGDHYFELMKEYAIFLMKDKRSRSFKLLAWLIILINYLSLVYFSLHLDLFSPMKWVLLVLMAVVVFTQFYRSVKKRRFLGEAELLPIFLVIMAGWMIMDYYWIGLMNGLILALAIVASRRLVVHFSDRDVVYPSFPKQRLAWQALNNVVLKDGILTIDFRSNKLSQQEIDEDLSPVDEKEFNEFCKAQLSK